jgi:hypothetical protein
MLRTRLEKLIRKRKVAFVEADDARRAVGFMKTLSALRLRSFDQKENRPCMIPSLERCCFDLSTTIERYNYIMNRRKGLF